MRLYMDVCTLLLVLVLLYTRLKAVFCQYKDDTKKYKRLVDMDYREWGSHARGVYPTQDTSCVETARVKQEEETHTGIIVI